MTSGALARLQAVSANFPAGARSLRRGGRVVAIAPLFLRVRGLEHHVRIGDNVVFGDGDRRERGAVIQVDHGEVIIAPYAETRSLRMGQDVFLEYADERRPATSWLGRVLNAVGEPMDGLPAPLADTDPAEQGGEFPNHVLRRDRIRTGLRTGVRVMDIFTPLCYGQRLGIFAGSGVGKSTLLSMLAKTDAFDVAVVALVGERGREVREFIDDAIGPQAMQRTVAIVATSDESAMMRRAAPDMAMRVAEYFRSRGQRVLLLIDSLTRYAHALREVGISIGELPVARGYPASVFTDLPKLLERAGTGPAGSGSTTAIISVLVDGDDHNDPVADAVRGILDGHVVLDRAIADQGRYPPIDPLRSLSRLASRVWSNEERVLVQQLRAMIARYEETADLRLLGGWRPGNDPALDQAVATVPLIYEALRQAPQDPSSRDPFAELSRHLKESQPSEGRDAA